MHIFHLSFNIFLYLLSIFFLFFFFFFSLFFFFFFFFQAEDGIRDLTVTGVQTCALPILQMEVMLDGHGFFSLPAALRIAEAVRPIHPLWLEDVIRPDCVETIANFREIGRASCREKGVDLGGRRIIKKKKKRNEEGMR